VAVRLTRWLVDRGVFASHAVVRFVDVPDWTVFAGGVPVEALPGNGMHAYVICCIGPDRDAGFREGLAAAIVETLPDSGTSPFIYIEFRPTDPADVWIAREGALGRADQLQPTRSAT
jgi:hypothetical protein